MPSLTERADDIAQLAEYLIERYATKARKRIRKISRSALTLFQAYDWPGSIRELQSRDVAHTPDAKTAAGSSIRVASSLPRQQRIQSEAERHMIETVLAGTPGRIAGANGAAAKLGIARQTLDSTITALLIEKHRFKTR